VPRVREVLQQKGMQDAWDTQLFVDRPWEHPSARQLADSLADMTAGMKHSTAEISKIVKKWDTTLGAHEGHITHTSLAMESQLVQAVRSALIDSEVLAVSYKWQDVRQGMPGDIDGLVVGWLPNGYGGGGSGGGDGSEGGGGGSGGDSAGGGGGSSSSSSKQVIIVCEAKYDIKNQWKFAVDQARNNVARLEDIWSIEPLDEFQAKDAKALRLMEFKSLPVMVALGGSVFPKDMQISAQNYLWRWMKSGWFCVQLDGATVVNHYKGRN
jgi:hypothetical protein